MQRSGDGAIGPEPAARPDPPRLEPEIIPPGGDFRPRPRPDGGRGFYAQRRIHIRITPPGPLGVAAVVVGTGIVGALAVLMLLGALLIGAATAGALIIIALIARLLARFRV